MKKMPAGMFKAKCLQLMDDIYNTHEEILVTKHGKPVVKVVPFQEDTKRPLFGYLQDTVKICGNIVAPISEKWNADD